MMLAIVLAFPPQAFAWDDLGHRTICEIAFREVRDETRQRIKKLIRGDREFARFADACTWPDHPRRRPTEHYVNLPRDSTGIGADPCPLADKCIVTAIAEDLQGLASVVVSDAEKLAKYLGHWVGDVHQPLHVSFADDCGGNEINTVGACIGSLHRAWDGCLIESALGRDVSSVAEILRNEVTPAQRADWTTSSPVDWANESFTIATSSPVAYCVRAGGMCTYDAGNLSLDPGEPIRSISLDRDYVEATAPIIRDRLKRAGVRLAFLLDQSLGQ